LELKKREDWTYELDVRSYEGPPLPLFILNTLKRLIRAACLKFYMTTHLSQDDFEIAFNRDGYKIVEMHSRGGEFRIIIEKD
jgi:TusA-related sulfurtransferase